MTHRSRVTALLLPALVIPLAGHTPAQAQAPAAVMITASTVFGPPEYQASQLRFTATGALTATGVWDFPEGKGGAVSIVDLTFTPDGSSDRLFLRIHSRRTAEVFDEATCAGSAAETGHWQVRGGTGAYTRLKGHGELAASGTYSGGDPAQDCAGLSETFTLTLKGSLTR
jgi:hypothetical protein